MKAAELIRRYMAGERDFSGVDLSGADLRGVDLRGANLSGANLSGADLRQANLSGASLRRAEPISGVDLGRITLSDRQLIMAILEGSALPNGMLHD